MLNLQDCIELSLGNDNHEIDVDFSVAVQGEQWTAYTAAISHRDILLFTDKGTVTFLVDSYGSRNVAEMFDWTKE